MILAVTGHRPTKLGGYSEKAFTQLVILAEYCLLTLKPEKVITGMALGWDQAVAQACINQLVPFVAAIPCIGQETKWPKTSQKYYHQLLEQAAEKHLVFNRPYDFKVMHGRNKWMVRNADTLLAMYDGSSSGTKHCVQYAKKMNITIYNAYKLFTGESKKMEMIYEQNKA